MIWFITARQWGYGKLFPLVVAVVVAGGLFCTTNAAAQTSKSKKPANEPQKIPGKVVAHESKGKLTTLTIQKEGGDKQEIPVKPPLAFSVVGKGDVGFFRPGVMVSATAVMSNNQLFAKEYTVHIGSKPPVKVTRDPNADTVYQICGMVTAADEDSVTLNFGNQGGVQKVTLEKEALVITVRSIDPDLAVEGAAVEIEGLTRAGKFLPTVLTVTLAEPLKAEDVFPADPKAKGAEKKTAKATAPKTSKTTKSKDDAPAGDTADPFGLLKKKDDKGKPADKKETDKKPTDK